jgi:hypothetical protein
MGKLKAATPSWLGLLGALVFNNSVRNNDCCIRFVMERDVGLK